LPIENIKMSTSSNVLGDKTSANTLTFSWTPKTTMNPSGAGSITMEMPFWYKIKDTGVYMYDSVAKNKCSSTCMQVTASELSNSLILIKYDNMLESCIKGA
jgi:hypothetical protein